MPLPPPPPPAPVLTSNSVPRPPAVASHQGCSSPKTDRSAFLAEIRKAGGGGMKLRPTKTVDKSAPVLPGSGVKRNVASPELGGAGHSSTTVTPNCTPRQKLNFAEELSQTLSGGHDRLTKRHGAQTLKPTSSTSSSSGRVAIGGNATLRPGRFNGSPSPVSPRVVDDGVFRGRPPPLNDDRQPSSNRPLPALPSKPPPLPKKLSGCSDGGSRSSGRPTSAKLYQHQHSQPSLQEHDESTVSVKALTEKWKLTPGAGSAPPSGAGIGPSVTSGPSVGSATGPGPGVGSPFVSQVHLKHVAKSASNLQLSGSGDETPALHSKTEANGSGDGTVRQWPPALPPTGPTDSKPRPPLPRKPPSEKPTIQQQQRKFRTLKPQQSAFARPAILKSTSNEDLAEPKNVELVINKFGGGAERRAGPATHRQLPHPPLPPSVMQRPDFAPPPPPPQAHKPPSDDSARNMTNKSLTSPRPHAASPVINASTTSTATDRRSGSGDSALPPQPFQAVLLNAKCFVDYPNSNDIDATPPAPPPRTDATPADDMERNFKFTSIMNLPPPPRFRNLYSKSKNNLRQH